MPAVNYYAGDTVRCIRCNQLTDDAVITRVAGASTLVHCAECARSEYIARSEGSVEAVERVCAAPSPEQEVRY